MPLQLNYSMVCVSEESNSDSSKNSSMQKSENMKFYCISFLGGDMIDDTDSDVFNQTSDLITNNKDKSVKESSINVKKIHFEENSLLLYL